MDLPRVTIPPAQAHTHTVIFLHARGDTPRTLSAVLTYTTDSRDWSLVQNYPSFRWVFPGAGVSPSAAATTTTNTGSRPADDVLLPPPQSQWFDVYDEKELADREEVQVEGLRASVAALRRVVAEEAARLGGRWDRVVLAGVGQGAAAALHTLINLEVQGGGDGMAGGDRPRPRRLGAVLGFSCGMPLMGRSLADTRAVLGLEKVPQDDEVIRGTPILLEHCIDDGIVSVDSGRQLRDQLRSWSAQVTWREYASGGHWIHAPKGMDDVREFVLEALGVSTPRIARLSVESGVGLIHAGFR
ncbi:hypothetical protein ACO1O0_007062 [Amphichorda felina]